MLLLICEVGFGNCLVFGVEVFMWVKFSVVVDGMLMVVLVDVGN